MSDLIDTGEPGLNAPEFSVSEISGVVKRMIEGEFSHVRIRGEIGRVSRPASGHLYLDLKDDRAVLASVIWKGTAARLRTRPEEGMEVIATGRLTTFPGQSRYQMVIEDIAPAGLGALMVMLEKRRLALEAEGLFAAERKQTLPYLPDVIGVITSPSGAVIRDILHRLRDRFPRHVLIWPVAVQGEKCAPEVTAAINGFNQLPPGGAIPRPDLIIVARGGGSVEDLWGFNEESVVRAAAASRIPLISAVGHETDTTLIDFASDRRAPTPTAAAELAVPVRGELLSGLAGLEARRVRAAMRSMEIRHQRLRDLARALPRPADLLAGAAQRLDHASQRLPGALRTVSARGALRLSKLSGRMPAPKDLIDRRRGSLDRAAARLPVAQRARRGQAELRLTRLIAGLRPSVVRRNVDSRRDNLSRLSDRLARAGHMIVPPRRDRFQALDRMRQTLGPDQTLARGYAVVTDAGGVLVTTRAQALTAVQMVIEFKDGKVEVVNAGTAKPRGGRPTKSGDGQGDLF